METSQAPGCFDRLRRPEGRACLDNAWVAAHIYLDFVICCVIIELQNMKEGIWHGKFTGSSQDR